MNRLEHYLFAYGESHQHKTNIFIHKICVPLIMFSSLGLLKALPVPAHWPMWLDFSTIAIFGVLCFYASLKNVNVFLSMLVFILFQIWLLELLKPRFFLLSFFLFVVAWFFQFIGHKIEGKKPSFFDDLFFLLIGPVWVINSFQQVVKNKLMK